MVRLVVVAALAFLLGVGLAWVAGPSPTFDEPVWTGSEGEPWYAHLELCEYPNEKDWQACMRANGIDPTPDMWEPVAPKF